MTQLILPKGLWRPSPNNSSRGGQKTRLIVAHDCEGSYDGSVGWFAMPKSQVSAHIVLSADGTVATQMVPWSMKAWHVCNFNPFSEGIEAAGFAAKGFGEPEWEALSHLVAYRLKQNGIPFQYASAANNWVGFCQHVDLGAAGGGHHDLTSDPAIRNHFVDIVRQAYALEMPDSWIPGEDAPIVPMPDDYVPSTTQRHDLVTGSTEWVQMRLNAIANDNLIVDGQNGPKTDDAIKAFQASVGLDADGIVGDDTRNALITAKAA